MPVLNAPYIGRPLAIVSIVLALALTGTASDPKFYPDDPLIVDNDTMDTPGQPAAVELSDLYDRFGHIFAPPGSSESVEPADPSATEFYGPLGDTHTRLQLVQGPQDSQPLLLRIRDSPTRRHPRIVPHGIDDIKTASYCKYYCLPDPQVRRRDP